MDYECEIKRARFDTPLTNPERNFIGLDPGDPHNAAVEVAVWEVEPRNRRTVGQFFYTWTIGSMTQAQVIAACRAQAQVLIDAEVNIRSEAQALGYRFKV